MSNRCIWRRTSRGLLQPEAGTIREKNYATIEKECLSIKAANQNFRVYRVGSTFTVVTDHKALKWLNTMKDNNPRLTRW